MTARFVGLMVAMLIGQPSVLLANPQLALQKNCSTCHAMDDGILGPGYRDIATRYAGKTGAENVLVQKIMQGGSGAWGPIPMPANTQVSEPEAKILVRWILSLP